MFNIIVDALATILDAAKAAGHIHSLAPHLIAGGVVTHLQYADDTILMVEGSHLGIVNLKFLLLYFEEMSGLTNSFNKSEVMALGYSEEEKCSIANPLNCKLGSI